MRRLALNQKTTNRWSVQEAVDGCVRAGLEWIGLWREPVHEAGLATSAQLVADAGLKVSSLCRGGFITALPGPERDAALADNRRAIDEAAALGTDCLVMVVGGLPDGSRNLPGARARVADGIADLVPHAQQAGVRLALEPMHPIYCADRGVLSTLDEALDMASPFPADAVGVVVDTFHVWWDPRVEAAIARAGERIASFQVCDWITPLPPDALLARGMMGDGHIDFQALRRHVEAAGYDGPIEVEIFNADVWAADPDEVVALMRKRYEEHVLD
ncbi:sugar phosphate isomerase/epimerase family protein [Jiangella gansuensis]|uniref:sugar phosphate isomerase/epimerase family protein n=1 Tax=Jiangella gansuensis TaxID=281473 RepID=UPI00055FD1B7|nr:sugar phosphate isomerase/epimerase family protein [Jiangella gansuensis]